MIVANIAWIAWLFADPANALIFYGCLMLAIIILIKTGASMGDASKRNNTSGKKSGSDYYERPPEGAERRIGANHYKRTQRGIFVWRDEWRRCVTLSDDEYDKADRPKIH